LKKFDVVLLTDSRYVSPNESNEYIDNVLKEDGLVEKALKNLGLKTTKKDWNDPNFQWNSTRLALFRTTWDYFDQFPTFKDWLDKVKEECLLINSYNQISWNLDKHYLNDLKNKGIPIPESIFIKKGTVKSLKEIIKKSWNEIVIKPTISGAARNTFRLKTSELNSFDKKWIGLIQNEDFIIQEFQNNILEKGEVALMLFGGEYTHSVIKRAKLGDFRVQDDFGGSVESYQPSIEMIDLAKQTISKIDPIPTYARVDIIWDNSDQLVVSELELIEPELWFRFNESSADKLAISVKEFLKNSK
jgi:glutathione synthase/RimK-type ligase-like ATP-grasp enzyme